METYVKVAGVWRYAYRAVDGYGQVIDVYVSVRRDVAAARRFFTTAIAAHGEPEEVVTDRAAALANVIEELLPQALHNTTKYANNRVECDHGRLKARLRPMRGLKTDGTATVIIEGHALIQNLRRGRSNSDPTGTRSTSCWTTCARTWPQRSATDSPTRNRSAGTSTSHRLARAGRERVAHGRVGVEVHEDAVEVPCLAGALVLSNPGGGLDHIELSSPRVLQASRTALSRGPTKRSA